jgi:hypothetical protein
LKPHDRQFEALFITIYGASKPSLSSPLLAEYTVSRRALR